MTAVTELRELREQRKHEILCRLGKMINEQVSPGIGKWEGAWTLVDGPTKAFLDALDRWGESGSAEDAAAVKDRMQSTLAAWTRANAEWEATGRPVTDYP